MATTYKRLFDPTTQFQVRSGALNVNGRLRVYRDGTDDYAECRDEDGTLLAQPIQLDSLGRCPGLLVDGAGVYRLEVDDSDGALLYTIRHLSPGGSGTGSALGRAYEVVSSDGTVDVTRFDDAGVTTFDLSLAEDSTDLLNWIRCDGAQKLDGTDTWRPVYAAGTMLVGERGIVLSADQYYHVTAHIRATKSSAAPYYDDIFLLYKLDDGTTVTPVTRQTIIVDCSLGLSQDFEFSTDVMAESDCELLLDILGQEQSGVSFEVLNVELHRVYSGAPHIPGGTIRAEQSDWTEADESKMSFIKHKPDLSLYVTDSELETILEGYATTTALSTGLASKQDTISDLSEIRAGAALGSTAVQPGDLATVALTGSYDDLLDKPTIPTVPVQDVEVNGSSVVNAQGVAEITIDTGAFVAVYGTTTMAQVTAAYDSGKDIVCRYNDGRGRVYSGQLSSFAYGVYTFSTTDGFTEYDFTLSPNGGDGAWAISSKAIPNVDSSYSASSYNAQSGVAVAQAVAGVNAVPASTTSDEDKVLTVNSQGEPEWDVLPVSTPEVFIAQYNVTTWEAIREAYVDGKVILLRVHAIPGQVPPIENEGELYLLDKIFESNVPTHTIARFYSGTSGATQGSLQKTVWGEYWVDGNDVWHHEARYALPYVNTEGKVLTSHSTGSVSFEDPVTQTVDQTYDGTSSNAQSGTAVAGALASYTPTASLSTVALTGDYDDLSNKPSIPVIGTITL